MPAERPFDAFSPFNMAAGESWLKTFAPRMQAWTGASAAALREAQALAAGSAQHVQKLTELQMATAAKAMSATAPADLAELSSSWAQQSLALATAEAQRQNQALARMAQAFWPAD